MLYGPHRNRQVILNQIVERGVHWDRTQIKFKVDKRNAHVASWQKLGNVEVSPPALDLAK
jgi:hypothetical protein